MKQHLNKLPVFFLTAVFGFGGFYFGSKDRKIELYMERPIPRVVSVQNSEAPTTAAPEQAVIATMPDSEVKIVKKTIATPIKPKQVIKKTTPAPVVSEPAPVVAVDPATVAPKPTTKVS